MKPSPIYLALDNLGIHRSLGLAILLRPYISGVKLTELTEGEGANQVVATFIRMGLRVWPDLKVHDTKSTMRRRVRAFARMGASFITIHASAGREGIRASVAATKEVACEQKREQANVAAVTVLSSFTDDECTEVYSGSILEATRRLTVIAIKGGAPCIVCPPSILKALADIDGFDGLIKITPGIRSSGVAPNDQVNPFTPLEALQAGADYLVIGREVTEAADPLVAMKRIICDIGYDHLIPIH